MFLRINLVPAVLASFLVLGCGGGGGSSGPNPPPPPSKTVAFADLPKGSFSLALKRTGTGTIPGDGNIYVQIVNLPCKNGSPCPKDGAINEVTYVTLDDTLSVTGGPNGNASKGVLTVAPADMLLPSFPVSKLVNGNVILPGNAVYAGSRIYISMGKALTQTVNETANGYIQTDFGNPTNDNIAIPFDFVEIAYDAKPQAGDPTKNTVAFGGNLTMVDQFGIPLAFTIKGVNGTNLARGITLGAGSSSGVSTRDEIITNYLTATTGTPFHDLTQPATAPFARVLAPYHVKAFQSGGANASFFDTYVDTVWDFYKNTPSETTDKTGTITYGVSGDGNVLNITKRVTGAAPPGVSIGSISKPTTLQVFQNNGVLQPGGDDLNAFGAILAASLNRHVADQPGSVNSPSAYYIDPISNTYNAYAKFWHTISIDKLAYGFGFDDVNNQSSVAILASEENIASLNIEVGW